MEIQIVLGIVGGLLLIGGALVVGVVLQAIGEPGTGWDWLVVAIAAAIGGLVASEFVVAFQEAGPVWDGLALVPALLGGLVVGIVVDAITRFSLGGRYLHHGGMRV